MPPKAEPKKSTSPSPTSKAAPKGKAPASPSPKDASPKSKAPASPSPKDAPPKAKAKAKGAADPAAGADGDQAKQEAVDSGKKPKPKAKADAKKKTDASKAEADDPSKDGLVTLDTMREEPPTDSAEKGAPDVKSAPINTANAAPAAKDETKRSTGVPRVPDAEEVRPRVTTSKRYQEDENEALSAVWKQLQSKDVGRVLKYSSIGGNVDSNQLNEFMKKEVGDSETGAVSEAQFTEKATAFFNTCVPRDDCIEAWQMVGGSISGKGEVQSANLADALAKLGCSLNKAEVDDLVAYASAGRSKITYAEFSRLLFP